MRSDKEEEELFYYRVTGKEVTPETYKTHLSGEEIIGVYPLLGDKCRFAGVDIDSPNFEEIQKIRESFPTPNYLERSRSGNHHIWMFFSKEVDVKELEKACRGGILLAKEKLGCHCGLYPSPPKNNKPNLGLLIALPFQGTLVTHTPPMTVFLDNDGEAFSEAATVEFLTKLKFTKLPSKEALRTDELWQGRGKKAGDKSRSGYDFTLAQLLLSKGLPRNVVHTIIKNRPDVHSTRDDYIDRTITQAKQNMKQTQAQVAVSWEDIEPINREKFFERMEKKLIIGDEQKQMLDLFYATLVANLKTSGRPIWMLIIGPPGCGKTLPMIALQHSPYVYATSSFRPAALISGWGLKGGQDMSLIPKLQNKILMVKDMSSLLSQNRDIVLEIMGLLRDAYDGSCSKAFGTGVARSYKSRFGFIGAATPDIDTHWSLNVRLGERFLRLRLSSTLEQVYGKIDRSLENLLVEDKTDMVLEETSLGYLKYLLRDEKLPRLSQLKEIGRLAQLGAILRTTVARNAYSRSITALPQWEEATRYAKQLAKITLGLAYLREKETNDEEELEDLKMLVKGGMDAKIEKLCGVIARNPELTTAEIGRKMNLQAGMVRVWLEDLNIAKIIMSKRSGFETKWCFTPLVSGMLKHFRLWPEG